MRASRITADYSSSQFKKAPLPLITVGHVRWTNLQFRHRPNNFFLREKHKVPIFWQKTVKKIDTYLLYQLLKAGDDGSKSYTESGTAAGSSSFSSGMKSSVNGMARESSSKPSIVESNSSTGAMDEQPEYKAASMGSLAGWKRW